MLPKKKKTKKQPAPKLSPARLDINRTFTIAKYIYRPMRRILDGIEYDKSFDRLRAVLAKVMAADKTNNPGKRNCRDGNLGLLTGFEFVDNAVTPHPFYKKCRTAMAENNTVGLVELPSITPARDIIPPHGACYFRILVALLMVDELGYQVAAKDCLGYFRLNERSLNRRALAIKKKFKEKAIFLSAIGIRFYDELVHELPPRNYETADSFIIHKAIPC